MDAEPIPHDEVIRYFKTAESTATWRNGDMAALRAETRAEALAVRGPLEPMAAVEAVDAGGVPARLYRPNSTAPEGAGGVVVWVHGGGWIHGDLDCYEGVARAMAAASGTPVLAVRYRLAPEHPYPSALDDVWSSLVWAVAHFDRVVVAGDSSGGNLVAATAIKARDVGVPLDLQILVYPVLDSTAGTAYKLRFRDRYPDFAGQPDFGATAFDRIKFIWEQYAQQPAQRTLPYASPMHAVSLHSVAPAVVVTAEHDILRGEAERYVERLRADGVPATLYEFPGQIHGFVQMRGVLSDAHRAMDLIAGSIRDALHHATDPSPKE